MTSKKYTLLDFDKGPLQEAHSLKEMLLNTANFQTETSDKVVKLSMKRQWYLPSSSHYTEQTKGKCSSEVV